MASQMKSPQSWNFSCLTTPRSSHRLSTPSTAEHVAAARAALSGVLHSLGRSCRPPDVPVARSGDLSSEPPDDPLSIQRRGDHLACCGERKKYNDEATYTAQHRSVYERRLVL